MRKGLHTVRPNGRGMIVVAAFSCAGVSTDNVVLDSHIVAKQNC